MSPYTLAVLPGGAGKPGSKDKKPRQAKTAAPKESGGEAPASSSASTAADRREPLSPRRRLNLYLTLGIWHLQRQQRRRCDGWKQS